MYNWVWLNLFIFAMIFIEINLQILGTLFRALMNMILTLRSLDQLQDRPTPIPSLFFCLQLAYPQDIGQSFWEFSAPGPRACLPRSSSTPRNAAGWELGERDGLCPLPHPLQEKRWIRSSWASLVAQMVKNLPAMRELWVQSLGQEDPLEKGMTDYPLQ